MKSKIFKSKRGIGRLVHSRKTAEIGKILWVQFSEETTILFDLISCMTLHPTTMTFKSSKLYWCEFFVHEISFRSRGPWGLRPETLAGWSNVKLFLCKTECQHFSIDFGCANLFEYANDGNWRNFLFRIAIWIILFSLFPKLNSLFQVKHFVNGWGLFRLTSLESKWIVRSDRLEIFKDYNLRETSNESNLSSYQVLLTL